MTIELTCECGAKLKAKPELSGQLVKCPTCDTTMTVPSRPADSEAFRVSCQCGKTFAANAKLAGKKLACPSCGLPSLPRAEPAIPAKQSVGRPDGSRRRKQAGSTLVDMVAGGFAVLHGAIAGYGLLQLVSLIVRVPGAFGPRALFSLGMLQFLVSTIASTCILVAGIGVLMKRKKWALEFGMPASFVYFGRLAFTLINLVWAMNALEESGMNLLGEGYFMNLFLAMVPEMVASSIGPALLIYISLRSERRR